ncbi:MAG: hypothetical protein K9I74_12310 [Bacteroidales bacterium]|nr:hypothetical protein [Bacteroidales bacterium]
MRNFFCRYYLQCVDRAAHEDADKLPCASCSYRHDTGGKKQITTEDPAGCQALIVAIFAKTYNEHRPHTWRTRFIEATTHKEATGTPFTPWADRD